MELRAHLEGIARKWWLLALTAFLSWWIGGILVHYLPTTYTSSTSILLNDRILTGSAFPSDVVHLTNPVTYEDEVIAPTALQFLVQTYPHLSATQLVKNITVSTDVSRQVLLISVTDISPTSAAGITNYLAHHFIKTQTERLSRQIEFYRQWIQQQIPPLKREIQQLQQQILDKPETVLKQSTSRQIFINQYHIQKNLKQQTLYKYEQSLIEIEHSILLLPQAYIIVKSADVSTPVTPLLPSESVQWLAIVPGLLLALCIITGIEFCVPVLRHKNELLSLTGTPAIAEVPQLHRFEQRHLLNASPFFMKGRIKPWYLLCSMMSSAACKNRGHIVLLTSPQRRHQQGPIMASFLAQAGYRTLLIEICSEKQKPCTRRMTGTLLLKLLPYLQSEFDLILLDMPPLHHPDTRICLTRAAQILIFLQKRRDSLYSLKTSSSVCSLANIKPDYVFLT